jgi:hypothetical protein
VRFVAGGALLLWTVRFPPEVGSVFAARPLATFVLVPQVGEHRPTRRRGRLLLVALAVGQCLQAYPVAGVGHVAWATIFAVVCGAVLIGDAASAWDSVAAPVGWRRHSLLAAPALVILALVTMKTADDVIDTKDAYDRGAPPAAPAESQLRLPQQEAALLSWLGDELSSCEQVVTSPGFNSVYVVLGIEPPTDYNTTLWAELLNDAEQQAIVDRLEAATGKVCEVVHPANIGILRAIVGYNTSNDQPLERFLAREPFTVVGEFAGWQVRILGRS